MGSGADGTDRRDSVHWNPIRGGVGMGRGSDGDRPLDVCRLDRVGGGAGLGEKLDSTTETAISE